MTRDNIISVRLNDEELYLLTEVKKQLNKSLSDVFRIALFSLSQNEQMKEEIKALGNNLYKMYKARVQRELSKWELSNLNVIEKQQRILQKHAKKGYDITNLLEEFNKELEIRGIDYKHKLDTYTKDIFLVKTKGGK